MGIVQLIYMQILLLYL